METSARNQFHCTVTAIHAGAVHDEIELRTVGGETLVATITRHSTQALDLKVGASAIALVKASSVLLAAGAEHLRFSARNNLAGKVKAVHRGAVNNEIVLALPGGEEVTAIITQPSSDRLNIKPNDNVRAIFKASAIILAVPA